MSRDYEAEQLARIGALLRLDHAPPEGYEPEEPEKPALVMHNADVTYDSQRGDWAWFCEGCWHAAENYPTGQDAQSDADAHNQQETP